MKKVLFVFLLIIAASKIYCQPFHVIRFIHEGNETKPAGNLVFSVEKLMKVTGDWGDVSFGHSYKTDMNTFVAIRNYISLSNYTSLYNKTQFDERYRIECSYGKVYYVYKYDKFFQVLKLRLEERNLDKKIVAFLSARYCVPTIALVCNYCLTL